MGILKATLAMRKSILVTKGDADPALSSPEPMGGTIDIWWVRADSGLLLLLPFLLTRHPKWSACTLRLFAVVSATDDSPGATKARLEAYLATARITAKVYTVRIEGEVADVAVANRTLDMEGRSQLASSAAASTMTMVARAEDGGAAGRGSPRRSVMDVFGSPPRGAPSTPPRAPSPVSEEGDDDGEAGGAVEEVELTPAPTANPAFTQRATRLANALSLNSAIRQHSSDAALVVTNLFVSRSADVKTFMLETELCMAGIPRALLVRGTGGEMVTSLETALPAFVGLVDRPADFDSEGGVVAPPADDESPSAPLSATPASPGHSANMAASIELPGAAAGVDVQDTKVEV